MPLRIAWLSFPRQIHQWRAKPNLSLNLDCPSSLPPPSPLALFFPSQPSFLFMLSLLLLAVLALMFAGSLSSPSNKSFARTPIPSQPISQVRSSLAPSPPLIRLGPPPAYDVGIPARRQIVTEAEQIRAFLKELFEQIVAQTSEVSDSMTRTKERSPLSPSPAPSPSPSPLPPPFCIFLSSLSQGAAFKRPFSLKPSPPVLSMKKPCAGYISLLLVPLTSRDSTFAFKWSPCWRPSFSVRSASR